MPMKLLSTSQAAKKLGISPARVQQLIWAKKLPAQQVGRGYVINESDLKLVEDRKPGRPPKQTSTKAKDKVVG